MSSQNENILIFEHPLNERTRLCLRIENLISKIDFFTECEDMYCKLAIVESLVKISALIDRSELKKDLISELERCCQYFSKLIDNPEVDSGRLADTMTKLNDALEKLRNARSALDQGLKESALLSTVRKRINIVAGNCQFDNPLLHCWLNQSHKQQVADINNWQTQIELLKSAISLFLRLLRDSAIPKSESTTNGYCSLNFNPSNKPSMIRIGVPTKDNIYPEISGNTRRISIRFLTMQDGYDQPKQLSDDVTFKVFRCTL